MKTRKFALLLCLLLLFSMVSPAMTFAASPEVPVDDPVDPDPYVCINSIDFSPDSTRLLTGGIDCCLFIWDVADPNKFEKAAHVHAPLGISHVKWIDNERFLTSGPDATVRIWTK